MSKTERKALADIAQAQNLLQAPIQTSLAFGTKKMKQDSAPENSTNYLEKLSVEGLNVVIKFLSPKERLIVQADERLRSFIQTTANKAKDDIEKAWNDNNTMVLNDDEIFRQACTVYPNMFGYASERLQFVLAKEMYERDPKSIAQYTAIVSKTYELIKEVQKTRYARDLESLKLLYKKFNPRIEKGVWYIHLEQHRDKAEPEGSGKVPDDKTLLSIRFALPLFVNESARRRIIAYIANFDTIVKELYDNKQWRDLWLFLYVLCLWENDMSIYRSQLNNLNRNIEVSWDVVRDFAKRVKQVALEKTRILADIKQWKLAQEL